MSLQETGVWTQNLSKQFFGKEVVSDLNIFIQRGEIYGLIGVNGAGKTTTVKMLTGLLTPSNGSIRLNGIDIVAERERAQKLIGYIPDTPFLYERLTVREYLNLIADLRGVSEKLREKRYKELIERFKLGEFQNQLIMGCSRGVKQKSCLVAGLIHDPLFIFLDEPTVGLDFQAITELRKLLKELAQKDKIIFLNTHSLYIAEKVCNRVGLMEAGRIEKEINLVQDLRKGESLEEYLEKNTKSSIKPEEER